MHGTAILVGAATPSSIAGVMSELAAGAQGLAADGVDLDVVFVAHDAAARDRGPARQPPTGTSSRCRSSTPTMRARGRTSARLRAGAQALGARLRRDARRRRSPRCPPAARPGSRSSRQREWRHDRLALDARRDRAGHVVAPGPAEPPRQSSRGVVDRAAAHPRHHHLVSGDPRRRRRPGVDRSRVGGRLRLLLRVRRRRSGVRVRGRGGPDHVPPAVHTGGTAQGARSDRIRRRPAPNPAAHPARARRDADRSSDVGRPLGPDARPAGRGRDRSSACSRNSAS